MKIYWKGFGRRYHATVDDPSRAVYRTEWERRGNVMRYFVWAFKNDYAKLILSFDITDEGRRIDWMF